MVRRRGDKTPPPPGGFAGARRRMFEDARRPVDPPDKQPAKDQNEGEPKRGPSDEKPDRRKD
jgi:hypothetical protein